MKLFNKFRETVFLKEKGNLEEQIEDLKRIPNYKENKDILKDIRVLEIGLQGEKDIAFELKSSNIGMYVLHDITIVHGDLKAQIDYVIITRGFTYLVECKNLYGNISVDDCGEFRREYEINGKKYKEAIYSPYTQAVRHKEILKRRWLDNSNKLIAAFTESEFDNSWYKPLVVLANAKSSLDIKSAPKEIKDATIRVDQLIRYIEDDLKKYDKRKMSSQKKMLELGSKLLNADSKEYNSIASKYGDIPPVKIKSIDRKDMIEKLKNFRKIKSKKMRVPAYYIFTDAELDRIIESSPKTLEELRNLKVLSDIKLRLHGEEIMSILNN